MQRTSPPLSDLEIALNLILSIGRVGDYDESVPAHRAIPHALALAADALSAIVETQWLPTEEIRDQSRLATCDGIWCVPASPYRSMDGALRAIRFAQEQQLHPTPSRATVALQRCYIRTKSVLHPYYIRDDPVLHP